MPGRAGRCVQRLVLNGGGSGQPRIWARAGGEPAAAADLAAAFLAGAFFAATLAVVDLAGALAFTAVLTGRLATDFAVLRTADFLAVFGLLALVESVPLAPDFIAFASPVGADVGGTAWAASRNALAAMC